MNDTENVNEECLPLQTKVFARWITNIVPNININNITSDLSNGKTLIKLAQALTHRKAPKDNTVQKPISNVINCNVAFKMLHNDGFIPNGVTSKDISNNNEKQIMEFIWQLITHYSIENSFSKIKENASSENVNSKLLSWAMKRTQNYKNI